MRSLALGLGVVFLARASVAGDTTAEAFHLGAETEVARWTASADEPLNEYLEDVWIRTDDSGHAWTVSNRLRTNVAVDRVRDGKVEHYEPYEPPEPFWYWNADFHARESGLTMFLHAPASRRDGGGDSGALDVVFLRETGQYAREGRILLPRLDGSGAARGSGFSRSAGKEFALARVLTLGAGRLAVLGHAITHRRALPWAELTASGRICSFLCDGGKCSQLEVAGHERGDARSPAFCVGVDGKVSAAWVWSRTSCADVICSSSLETDTGWTEPRALWRSSSTKSGTVENVALVPTESGPCAIWCERGNGTYILDIGSGVEKEPVLVDGSRAMLVKADASPQILYVLLRTGSDLFLRVRLNGAWTEPLQIVAAGRPGNVLGPSLLAGDMDVDTAGRVHLAYVRQLSATEAVLVYRSLDPPSQN